MLIARSVQRLSDACKAQLEARAGAKKHTDESAKMGKEEGHAQTGAQLGITARR
jgi:hypothetical protein